MRRACVLLLASLAAPAWAGEAVFTFVDASGAPVAVRGAAEPERALLLHFFATWCSDCAADLAHLAEASAGCDRARVLAIDVGEDADVVAAYLAKHALRLPVLRDPEGDAWRRLDGRGLPANAIWSAAGHRSEVGPKSREQWLALLGGLGCRSGAGSPVIGVQEESP